MGEFDRHSTLLHIFVGMFDFLSIPEFLLTSGLVFFYVTLAIEHSELNVLVLYLFIVVLLQHTNVEQIQNQSYFFHIASIIKGVFILEYRTLKTKIALIFHLAKIKLKYV